MNVEIADHRRALVRRQLQAADASHPLLADLAAKASLFDDAASRFAPSVTA